MTNPLAGRRVVLGVCGGIAAYKVVELCRRLVDAGAHVIPVMTEEATRFVGPVTFSALASEKVQTSLWSEDDPIPHTHLGRSAELIIVAPATANFLARYAGGMADDLLSATLLATKAPVLICPAMHTEMWEHPAVQDNVRLLQVRGVRIAGPVEGHLAGGDEGAGRMVEPATIVAAAEATLTPQDLAELKIVVTAGGTREPIDPVRFIGNRSSGKQGHAIAAEAAMRGAHVTLITTADQPVAPGVDAVRVETAAEMAEAVLQTSYHASVLIMAAAVADFRPANPADQKLTKSDGLPDIVLEPTVDILRALDPPPSLFRVGFAAETDAAQLEARARVKLREKELDLIVANDVSAPDAGFEADTNRAVLIFADGTTQKVPLVDKRELARLVLDAVAQLPKRPPERGNRCGPKPLEGKK